MSGEPDPEAHHSVEIVRPAPVELGTVRRSFTRGRKSPRGVVWFGLTSFWGHLRHFLAAAIATEDIDSRDWMTPDLPQDLVDRVAQVLGGRPGAPSLMQALDRDLWIDYVADTGDDVSVSAAVGRLVAARYELPDPDRPGEHLLAPRGDILFFGGDTAYPVATAQEITDRVLIPFNRALEPAADGRARVLLGVPGNHDWYDGLDGFGRMFRRHDPDAPEPRPSLMGISRGMLDHYSEWAREFVRGGKIDKPKALVLSGYTPVQNASYFILPLTPTIHLFAVDRQLKRVDSQQRHFHQSWYHENPEIAPWVLLPDPLYRFGGPSRTGTQSVHALGLDFHARPHFLLSGDVHHYERLRHDKLLHVTAGGGGAFLHPAPMFEGRLRVDVCWPDAGQSRALLRHVPWKVARGRSGFLPHLALAAVFGPAIALSAMEREHLGVAIWTPLLAALTVGTVFFLIGGFRKNPRRVALLAYAAGAVTALIPMTESLGLDRLLVQPEMAPFGLPLLLGALLLSVFLGAWVFGAYLSLLTRLGLEHTQAFTALDHPGFKHFVRFRVRKDRTGIDGWCVGLQDPLRPGEQPVLVDQIKWRL